MQAKRCGSKAALRHTTHDALININPLESSVLQSDDFQRTCMNSRIMVRFRNASFTGAKSLRYPRLYPSFAELNAVGN